jgi:hypothetical protein
MDSLKMYVDTAPRLTLEEMRRHHPKVYESLHRSANERGQPVCAVMTSSGFDLYWGRVDIKGATVIYPEKCSETP